MQPRSLNPETACRRSARTSRARGFSRKGGGPRTPVVQEARFRCRPLQEPPEEPPSRTAWLPPLTRNSKPASRNPHSESQNLLIRNPESEPRYRIRHGARGKVPETRESVMRTDAACVHVRNQACLATHAFENACTACMHGCTPRSCPARRIRERGVPARARPKGGCLRQRCKSSGQGRVLCPGAHAHPSRSHVYSFWVWLLKFTVSGFRFRVRKKVANSEPGTFNPKTKTRVPETTQEIRGRAGEVLNPFRNYEATFFAGDISWLEPLVEVDAAHQTHAEGSLPLFLPPNL